MKHPARFLLAAATLVAASSAHAASGAWTVDANGDWSTVGNWTGSTIADGVDSTATFINDITADRTVNLDADRTIGNITFGDAATATAGSWIISGSQILTLDRTSGTPTITVNALGTGKTATISSVIAGNDGLTISSAGANGTLTLSGNNTYSGLTTINTQATGAVGVIAAHNNAFGSSSILLNGSNQFASGLVVNAGLTIGNAITLKSINSGSARANLDLGSGSTWSGNISVDNSAAPTGGIAVIIGRGTNAATASVVSGNITQTAPGTNTNALVLRQGSGFGKITGSVSMGTSTVQLLDASSWEFSNASNTWGKLDLSNVSAVVYAGVANTLASSGVVSSTVGGTLRLNNLAGTTAYSQTIAGLSGNINVGLQTGAATLTLNTTLDQSSSGVISGAISLIKSGSAIQTLTGANTYSGTTTIDAGALNINGTLRNTAGVTVNSGATATFGVNNLLVLNHGVAVAASRVLTVNGGTLVFADFDSRIGNVTLNNGGTLTSNSVMNGWDMLLANTDAGAATVAVTGTGLATMNGTGGIHLQGVQNFDVADTVAGSGADLQVSMILASQGSAGGAVGGVNKLGLGTMVLSGANTYNGGTTINGGTLRVANNAALGTGAVSVNVGTLQVGDGTANTVTLGSAANLVVADGAFLKLGALNLASIDATAGTNGVIALSGGGVYNFNASGKLDLNGILDGVTAGSHTYNLITGSGAVTGELLLANIEGYNNSIITLNSFTNGTLTFTAVPEPSTYGLIGASALAAVAMVRRRRKHVVQA